MEHKGRNLLIFLILCSGNTSIMSASVQNHSLKLEDASSEFCLPSNTLLYCDFKWKVQNINLDVHPTCKDGEKCSAIVIERVHELHYDNSICVELSLKHISKVNFEGKTPSDCSKMGLSVQNVTLDFVDEKMNSLYVDESHIKTLSFEARGGQLTLIGSTVEVLSVPRVHGTDGSLKIHSSVIKDFQRLHLHGQGRLHLQDSTVEDLPPESLVLDSSQRNRISGVTFTKFKEELPAGLILKNGADVTIEDIKGGVKISSPSCPNIQADLSLPSVAIGSEGTTPKKDDLHIDFVEPSPLNNTMLILALTMSVLMNFLFFASVIIFICIFLKARKLHRKRLNQRYISKHMAQNEKSQMCG